MAVVVTTIGQGKIAAALAGGDPIDFNDCDLAVGDGNGAYYTLSESQTALVNEVWRGAVNRGYVDPANLDLVLAEALIPAGVGGWTIREAGLFDGVGDLLAVALYPLTEKPAPGGGSEKQIYVRLALQITNGEDAIIEISPNLVMATQAEVDTHTGLMAAHGATVAATPDRMMLRNAAGQTEVAAGSSGAQAVNYTQLAAAAAAASAGDANHAALTAPHGAVAAAMPNRLMLRNASGQAEVANGTVSSHAVNLGQLQTALAAEAAARTGSDIPAGSIALWVQTAAPTGWTKVTTHNNKALRVVSGTAGAGGSVAFTSAFAARSVSGATVSGTVGQTTLSISQIPAHDHAQHASISSVYDHGTASSAAGATQSRAATSEGHNFRWHTHQAGGGGSHGHSFAGASHDHDIDLAVQYVDVIIASKN